MKVISLVENTSLKKEYKKKHGLSLYIECKEQKILFDLGPDKTFFENAKKLNVDISDIDIVVISHGHKDHGGGLKSFLEINKKAKIYISEKGFENYYTSILKYGKLYVGLDKDLENNQRIIKIKGNYKINEMIYIFSNNHNETSEPSGNKALFQKVEGKYILDDFSHEQSMLLKNENQNILFSGCSHKGIVNIIKSAEDLIDKNTEINIVFAGFHLVNPVSKKMESNSFIQEVSKELSFRNTNYYTFHCTGEKAFNILEERLGDRIIYLRTGGIIEI